MIKKSLALLLTVLMLLSMFPVSVFATGAEGGENAVVSTEATGAEEKSASAIDNEAGVTPAREENERPDATVSVLKPIVLTQTKHDYMVWPSGDDSIDRPLQIVMNFKANETQEQAAAGPFAKFKCDFYLTCTGLENGSVEADGCYLAGNYGSFGWIVIPTDDLVIENGVSYPVVAAYDANLKYAQDICGSVKDFTAAIYITEAILAANPDFKIELALKMTNPDDETDVLTIGEPAVYTAEDLQNAVYGKEALVIIPDDVKGDAKVVEEIENNTALDYYIPENVPAGAELVIELKSVEDTIVYDVAPMANGTKVEPNGAITFRLPIPESVTQAAAKVYHEGTLMGTYTIEGAGDAKYVEISSADFSEFAVEPTDTFTVAHGTLEIGPANTLEEVVECNDLLASMLAWNDPTVLPVVTVNGDFVVTQDFTIDGDYPINFNLNGKTLTVAEGVTLSIGSKVQITGAGALVGDVKLADATDAVLNIADSVTADALTVTDANGNTMVKGESGDYEPAPAQNIEVTDAEGNVTYYEGFSGFSNLDLANCTIKLLADVSDANLILNKGDKVLDTNVTLDLNGFTFSRAGSSSGAISLTQGAELTILDSSEAKTGKILSSTFGVWIMNGALVLESGVIETTSTKDAAIFASAADATIRGGEIISAGNAILVGENFMESRGTSTVEVLGGEIKAAGYGIVGGKYAQAETAVAISGGKITSVSDSISFATGAVAVTGGTFSSDVSDYCVDGFEVKQNADGTYGVAEAAPAYVAEVNGVKYGSLTEALAAVKDDADVVTILCDIEETVTAAYLRGNIVPADGITATITLTNSADWVYLPYTFVIGEGITLKVPNHGLFYYAGGAVIKGEVIADAYYQMYAGTKLTVEGTMTITSETFILRYTNDAKAGIYVNGGTLNASVIYFYQGMISATNGATINAGVYWQTNDTDGQGSANLVLDNSTLNVTVNEHNAKATGNSTVTLTNGSIFSCAKDFEYGENAVISVDDTSVIKNKDGEIQFGLKGSGTEADPYIINNVDDLKLFRDMVNSGTTFDNQFVKLTADIDLAGAAWTPIGTKAAHFSGTFDGGNFTVSNLVVAGENNVGFFGYADGCSIKNLKLKNVSVTGADCVGAIAGQVYSTSTIDNCHVSGLIQIEGQTNVGGIVGKYYVKVSNCSVIGDDAATSYIKGVYNKADLEGDNVGGIMGHGGEDNNFVGNTVKNITISGTRKVGGIVGTTDRSTDINGCAVENVVIKTTATAEYAAGNTSSMDLGGLIGHYYNSGNGGVITDVTVSGVAFETNGLAAAGAIIGGDRSTPDSAPVGVTASNVTVSNVTGATQNYMLPVAQIGEETYATLAEAIAAAQAGDVVTILADITFAENAASIIIDKALTIKGIDKTQITRGSNAKVTLTFNSATSAFVIKSGNVTFDNLIIVQGTKDNSFHISVDKGAWNAPAIKYSNITIKNVDFIGGDYALCLIGENVVVDGCTFTNQDSHNIIVYSLKGDSKIINNVFNASKGNNKSAILYEGGADNATDLSGFIGGGTLTLDNNIANGKGVFFQFTNWKLIKDMELVITNNQIDSFTNKAIALYDLDGAIKASGDEFASVAVNKNVFTNVPSGRPIIKEYTGTVVVDASENYLGSETPNIDELILGDLVVIKNYYTDAELTNLVATGLEGEGTEEDPYIINNIDDLKLFRDMVNSGTTFDNQFVKLNADIDLNGEAWTSIGTKAAHFSGTFDGNNKTISNLVVSGTNNVGFFGYADGCSIKNLKLNNVSVAGADCVGAIAGQVYSTSTIDNCHVSGSIKIEGQTNVGGIVGKYYVKVSNSSVIGDDAATSYIKGVYTKADLEGDNVGGIMGHGGESNNFVGNTVKNITISGTRKVGGIVGTTDRSTDLSGCVVENVVIKTTATAEYAADNTSSMDLGGLIGHYYNSGNGGVITDVTVSGVAFETNGLADAGAIVGGDRSTPNAAPAGVTASNVTVSNVTGATQKYLLPAVAQIGEETYATLAEAIAAAKAGDEIILLADVAEDVTVPAGVIFNGNGKQVGNIIASGDITFKGHTKALDFDFQYTNSTVNIGAGACLELTGTNRLVIGHGATFNITGTITDAKTADKATIQPSLIVAAGASITGAGVTFNVTDAYIKFNGYCSSSKTASGTFNFNVTNSIWEQSNKLAFEAQSTAATVNFELKDSVLTTTSHLVFGVSRGEIVIDNSNVNVGTSRQIENQSTMTIKNGSVVNGAVATSSNAKNPGTIIVENATYAVTGEFSGSDLGTGTIIVKNGATVSAGSITKANIQIDATGMKAGDEINLTANLSKFVGTLEVINNNTLEAKIVDGKIVLAAKPVAQIGEETYATLAEAIAAAQNGETVTLLADVALSTTLQIKSSITLNGNGHKITPASNFAADGHGAVIVLNANASAYDETVDVIVNGLTINGFTGLSRVIRANFCDAVIEGCTFEGNSVSEGVITSAYAALTVKDCTFNGNTSGFAIVNVGSDVSNGTTLVANIDGNSFTDNEAGIAVMYLASSANVTGNEFKDNEHTGSNANAAAILAGPYTGNMAYTIDITENAFVNAMGSKPAVFAEDWSSLGSTTAFDLSSNYWDGAEPTEGTAYATSGDADVTLEDYYTVYANGTLDGLTDTAPAVAVVDGVEYKSLQEAIDAADGKTVTLIADVTLTETLKISNKSVKIDGNNCTITIAFADGVVASGISVSGTSNVTIANATITGHDVTGSNYAAITASGVDSTLTLENCTFTGNTGNHVVHVNAAVLNINGCTFDNNDCASQVVVSGVNGTNNTVTISNSIFKNNDVTNSGIIYFGDGSTKVDGMTLTVENCTFTDNTAKATESAIIYLSTAATITGCLFEDNIVYGTGGASDKCGVIALGTLAGNTVINGNAFVNNTLETTTSRYATICSTTKCDVSNNYWGDGQDAEMATSAGKDVYYISWFKVTKSSFAASYAPNSDGNGVTVMTAVAEVNGVGYADLREAIAAAQSGETITLLADVELTSTLKIESDDKITLDLNGKVVDGTGNVKIAIMSYGDLTIKDSVGEGTIKAGIGTAGNAINICAGSFTLESGNIYSLNNAILIDEQAATVTIKGGKITAEPTTKNSAAFYISSTSETVVNIEGGELVGYNGILLWNNTIISMTGGSITASGNVGIQGNGTNDNTKISISGDASVSGYYTAIYHPQGGELNISGSATLTGWTGVVVKGGKVNISGGTISGTGEAGTYKPVSSGFMDTGDGLYVEHYDNSTNSENYGTPVVTVTGGTFTSVNGKAVASYVNTNNNVEALDNFISGGTFSSDVNDLCADGFVTKKNSDGTYGVIDRPMANIPGVGTLLNSNGTYIHFNIYSAYAEESIVLKLYAGDVLIATCEMVNPDYLKYTGGNGTLTANFEITRQSSTWDTVWVGQNPDASVVPTRVELYIDGEYVDDASMGFTAAQWASTEGVKTYVAQIGETKYESLDAALVAAQNGDTVKLLADVEIAATTNINKSITIDGNGHKLTQAEGFKANGANVVFDIYGKATVTFTNLTFDSIKNVGIIRTVDANLVMDNCTVQNCKQTVSQGLLRLACGNATITNSKFLNNDCTMVLTFGYDAANDTDVLTVDNCVFEGNTCGETAVVYFADGDYGKVTNTKFINNTVSSAGNAATLYMGWGAGFEVSGCLFDGNEVTTSHATTKRFASAIFADGCKINNNVFLNNTATRNGEAVDTTVAVAAYYGEASVSGNYWNGGKPAFTVEYDRNAVEATNYYKSYNAATGELTELTNISYVARVGTKFYATLADAIAAAKAGETVKLLSDIKLTGKLTITKAITIDGDGHSIIADETAVWYTVSGKLNIKNYKTHLIGVNSNDVTLKNVTLDCNNNAAGINLYCAQNVVFDNVSIINATKGNAALTVNGSTVTFKTAFTALGNAIALDISNGSGVTSALGVTVEDGTVFDLGNKTVKFASTAVNDMSGAVNAEGKPYFAAMDSAYFYTLTQIVNRTTPFSNGLTLFTDVELNKDLKIGSKLILNGNKLTLADGTKIVASGNLTIDGLVEAEIQIPAGKTLTGVADMNVTTVDGYKVVYANGVYTSVAIVYVAQIGETKYESLQDAVNAAQAGDTITLIADATGNVTISKKITLAGNGTVTGTFYIYDDVTIASGADVNCASTFGIWDGGALTISADAKFSASSIYFNGGKIEIYGTLIATPGNDGGLILNGADDTINVYEGGLLDVSYVDVYKTTGNSTVNVMGEAKVGFKMSDGSAKFTWNIKENAALTVAKHGIVMNSAESKIDIAGAVTATNVTNAGTIVLTNTAATLTANECGNVTTNVADHKVVYANGVYTCEAMVYVAEVNGVKCETLTDIVDAVKSFSEAGVDAIVKFYADTTIEKDQYKEFAYGTGNIIFTADAPVTVTLKADFDFIDGEIQIKVEKNVTLNVYDNAGGIYVFYGPGMYIEGTVGGGQNWGCLYLAYGKHTVAEGGKLSIGRVHMAWTELTVNGEIDSNYLLVEESTLTLDGALVDANYITDSNNGGLRYGASKIFMINGTAVKAGTMELKHANSVLTMDLTASLTTNKVQGAGKIVIDVADFNGNTVELIKGDMSGFTGEIELINNNSYAVYEITESGLKIAKKTLAGKGTEAEPYMIKTVEDLILFRDSVNAGETKYNAEGVYVALGANIDLAGIDWSVNIGDDCNATFDGIFDGKGYTISNLTSTETAQKGDGYVCTGLFGAIYGTAVIKNLTIHNATINVGNYTGSNIGVVVGFAYSCTGSIENVNVIGDIKIDAPEAYAVGTIVGYAYYGKLSIKDCTVAANAGSYINANSEVGGIVGYGAGAKIENAAVENLSITGTGLVGGIAGLMFGDGVINGATVSNVTLTATKDVWANSAAIAVGTISGEGTTVSNVTATNVNSTKLVGSAYAEKPTTVVPAVQAKIGDKYYTTFAAAYAAAKDGETITLLTAVTVEAGETLTLDKAVTITYTSNVPGEDMITNKGTLIIDGATLVYTNTDTTASNATVSTISSVAGSTLEVKSGVVKNDSANNGALGIYAYAIDLLTNGSLGDVTATISGGEVISTNYMAIRQFNNGDACKNTLNVTGGYIYGAKRAIQVHLDNNAAYTTITGGEIEGGDYSLCFLTTSENLTVEGGTFKGEVWFSGTKGFISGGTFDKPVEAAYCAEGYVPVDNADGTYGVRKVTYVAAVGEQKYESLQDALDAAAVTGGTVVVLNDVDMPGQRIYMEEGTTLDLNGYTVTAKGFVAFGEGGSIVDNGATKGLLAVPKGYLVMTKATYPMLPVWNEENTGYVFVAVTPYLFLDVTGENSFLVDLRPNITGGGISTSAVFKDGALDNGLVFELVIHCMKSAGEVESIHFAVSEDLIKTVYNSDKMIRLTIGGASTAFDQYVVEFKMVSDSGVAYSYVHETPFVPTSSAQ